jgi:hypothetical protein
MEFDMTIDAAWVEDSYMEFCTDERFIEFLKKFRSKNGFISFLPDNIEELSELVDPHNPDYWKAVAVIIQYCIFDDESIRNDVEFAMLDHLEGNSAFIRRSHLGL